MTEEAAVTVTAQPGGSAAQNRRPSLWRRAGWLAVCLSGGLLLQSLFHQPVGLVIKAGILTFVIVAGFRTYYGLLLLAGFGPLATALFHLGTTSTISVRFAEAMALALITGWAGSRAASPAPLTVSPGTRWAGILLLTAAVASGLTQAARIRTEAFGEPLGELVQRFVTRDYLLNVQGSAWITAAALLCEGVLLLLLVADACARSQAKRDSVLSMMVTGAAAAGCLNVLRIVTVSMAREDGWTAFLHYMRTLRVNVQFADLNAAGSYFALMLLIGLGLVSGRRTLAAVCVPPIAAALWMAGSRFALGAAIAAIAVGAIVALRGRWGRVVPVLAGVLLAGAVAAALWKFYPENRNAAANVAFNIRVVLAKAGLDMAARNPVFGVGVGSYYEESEPYLQSVPPGIVGPRENAHNYFVQILAELGVSGLVIFLAALAAPIHVLWRSAAPLPATSIGLLAGLIAFLLSCVGGHPLIVPEASYPFWIALGLAAAPLAGCAARARAVPRIIGIVAAAAIAVFVVTLPHRIAVSSRMADMSAVSIGLSPHWQRDPDGTRYRWAGGRSTFFVHSSAGAVSFPLRNRHPERLDLEVRVFLNGREADRVRLPAHGDWREFRLISVHGHATYSRIDFLVCQPGSNEPVQLEATDERGAINVGRPSPLR